MAPKPWGFSFSALKTPTLENPVGYRALNDKALAEEVTQTAAQTRAFQGTTREVSVDARRNGRRIIAAIEEKAWNVSWTPIKSLGMNLVMLYFGGAGAGIFAVLIISYALLNAFKTLLSVNEVFQALEDAIGLKKRTANYGGSNSCIGNIDPTEFDGREERHPLMRFFCSPFLLQKLVFVTICVAIISYIGYHASTMGILPLRSGDYLGLIPEPKIINRAIGIL